MANRQVSGAAPGKSAGINSARQDYGRPPGLERITEYVRSHGLRGCCVQRRRCRWHRHHRARAPVGAVIVQTWGYWDAPTLPERVTIDGQEYRRIERLPRNLRPGDLLCLGDATDRAQYHQAYVTIRDVETWPASGDRYRWSPPQCRIRYSFRDSDAHGRMARTWGTRETVFRGDETKRPVTWAYRPVS